VVSASANEYARGSVVITMPGGFFFQAEDGIRDFHVTGVQTCALPICGEPAGVPQVLHRVEPAEGLLPVVRAVPPVPGRLPPRSRSEERRVGKERRVRRSPEHDSTSRSQGTILQTGPTGAPARVLYRTH